MAKVTHIGGRMYGDDEWVVTFENVDSTWAPLKATVMGDQLGTAMAEVTFGEHERKPTCGLAAQAIEHVARAVARQARATA